MATDRVIKWGRMGTMENGDGWAGRWDWAWLRFPVLVQLLISSFTASDVYLLLPSSMRPWLRHQNEVVYIRIVDIITYDA